MLKRIESLEGRCMLAATFPLVHPIHETPVDSTHDVRAIDMDDDGDVDVVSASYNEDKFQWHENVGNDVFKPHDLPGTFDGALRVEVGDIDGDDVLDIVGGSASGQLMWFQGTKVFGGLVFGDAKPIDNEVDSFRDLVLEDMDGDGDLDVIAAHNYEFQSHENRGGDFSAGEVLFSRFGLNAQQVRLADFNGDKLKDLVVGLHRGAFSANDPVRLLLRNEDGSFGAPSPIISGEGNVRSFETDDFDGDGLADLVVGFESGELRLFRQSEESTELITDQLNGPRQITAGDLDGDGDLDLVVASVDTNQIYTIENSPQEGKIFPGVVAVDAAMAMATTPTSVDAADADDDGDLDIVAGFSAGNNLVWLENRGLGDVNNDKVFDSSDLVLVFSAGEYEDDVEANSTFETGDWNGDDEFDTSDLVAAFRAGRYVG